MDIRALTILISTSLFLCISVSLIMFFYKVWWYPIRIQKLLSSQGIKGPSYKFIHGSTKEILNMTFESTKNPMELTHDILPRLQPHLHLWMKVYGRNFLCWHGYKAQLYLTEPDLIKEVLNNKNGVYLKIKHNDMLKKLLGDGIVLAEGEKWYRHRKLANHAFHMENLKGMIPTMIASVENMLERWGHHEKKEIEVLGEFKILTSDVISRTAFGSNYLEGQRIFDLLTKLVFVIVGNAHKMKLPVIGRFTKSDGEREADKLEHEIRESFVTIIRTRKEKINNGQLDGFESDYLGLLVKENQENYENKRISINDVIDECKTFYFAGQETTMNLLTWTMLLLAIHTDWQEKARKEVFGLFGKNNPDTEDNNIAKMKTMTMVINETLRLYPPSVDLRRTVASSVRLGKFLLPPDIDIIIPPLATHHDPKLWGEDVHLFKPDRFCEGVTNATENVNGYLPFGMGPRICVGVNFSIIEVKLAISMILQRYSFTLSPTYVHSPICYMTTRPQHGVQIILHSL